jgi:hypothetical protein
MYFCCSANVAKSVILTDLSNMDISIDVSLNAVVDVSMNLIPTLIIMESEAESESKPESKPEIQSDAQHIMTVKEIFLSIGVAPSETILLKEE